VDQRQWDERYASTELVWTAEANRFVVDELAGLAIRRAGQARRPVLTGDGERTAIDTVVRAPRR
jgi:hypothetical protein